MKKFIFLFLFAAYFVNAQTQRFIYEYKYIPDINNKADVKSDLMALDISKTGSVYSSLTKMQADSAMHAQIEKMVKNGNSGNFIQAPRKAGMIGYEVSKDYPDYKVFLTEQVGRDRYKISEDEKPDWKIFGDKQKIGEYNAQKATTNFGGRSWIAWFSTDLPFQEGPYKFYGLPGLIVKMEDTTGSHIMTLVANKKLIPNENGDEINVKDGQTTTKVSFGTPPIPVTETQFKKVWKNYIADPAKDIRGAKSGISGDGMTKNIIIMKDASGNTIDPAKMAKNIEEGLKNKLAHDNNKIEPTLYQ